MKAINAKDKRLYGRRHGNEINQVLKALRLYKKTHKAVTVESTYSWYWLVDGLEQAGFKVCLANPSAIETFSGMRCS